MTHIPRGLRAHLRSLTDAAAERAEYVEMLLGAAAERAEYVEMLLGAADAAWEAAGLVAAADGMPALAEALADLCASAGRLVDAGLTPADVAALVVTAPQHQREVLEEMLAASYCRRNGQ